MYRPTGGVGLILAQAHGDMGCHLLMSLSGLKLGYPVSVECSVTSVSPVSSKFITRTVIPIFQELSNFERESQPLNDLVMAE
jgi:hypothetical protein